MTLARFGNARTSEYFRVPIANISERSGNQNWILEPTTPRIRYPSIKARHAAIAVMERERKRLVKILAHTSGS
jgi:hypothetical protein